MVRTHLARCRWHAGRWLRGLPGAEAALRLHRDESGDLLEYAMAMGFIAIPLIALFDKLFEILSDYFGMIAFYVTWPFL